MSAAHIDVIEDHDDCDADVSSLYIGDSLGREICKRSSRMQPLH